MRLPFKSVSVNKADYPPSQRGFIQSAEGLERKETEVLPGGEEFLLQAAFHSGSQHPLFPGRQPAGRKLQTCQPRQSPEPAP